MNVNIDNLDLLDKGLEYKSKIDEYCTRFVKICIIVLFLIGIGFTYMSINDDLFRIECLILSVFCYMIPFFVTKYKKHYKKKIIEIENLTDKFEAYKVTVKIVSKSQEINSRMTVNQNQYGSSIHKSTNQKYLVGIRTESGNSAIIYSKQLYMGSAEGEFIDILVKQKLDKNGNVIDSAHIPIMETIRATL